MTITLDDHGMRLPAYLNGSYDLYFDEQYVWSFTPGDGDGTDTGYYVRWPTAMKFWLNGSATVTLREGDKVLYEDEVTLGEGKGRISFIDDKGIPVMIDKWGLLQRPFSGRGAAVVEQMIDITEEIIAVLDGELGIKAWLAFGSLLGAAREGKVIGHDSDVDLAYLSHQDSIVGMNREIFEITRVLRRAGLRVLNKSGSFVTVLFTAPDGAVGSIDVYSTFHLDGLLYETATVRAPVPTSAIEPLSTLEFEGRELPTPADPDAMLEVSYGPNWRVPDPSFQHTPPPSTTRRFDGWFGSLMHQRREWERWVRTSKATTGDGPTAFGAWALESLPEGAAVVDIGAGVGRDTIEAARRGATAYGLDFARGAFVEARRLKREEDLDAVFTLVNLYDYRDAVTRAAEISHDAGARRIVLAGCLLDSLEPDGHDAFYAMLRMILGRGGTAYLEFAHDLSRYEWLPGTGGHRHEVRPGEVRRRLERIGGRVDLTTTVPASRATEGQARTRMVVRWPRQGTARGTLPGTLPGTQEGSA